MYRHFEVTDDDLLALDGQTSFPVYGLSGGLSFVRVRYRLKHGARGFCPYPEVAVADGPWQATEEFQFNASEVELAELEKRFASIGARPETESTTRKPY